VIAAAAAIGGAMAVAGSGWRWGEFLEGEGPMAARPAACYPVGMKLLIFTLVLLLLFCGCFFLAGLLIGGEVLGLILLMGAIIYWTGESRAKA
jgi:hypothetical protein